MLLGLLSSFFSGSETALFSLTRSQLHRYSLSHASIHRAIARTMQKPQNILITILIGNLFVNIVISALATRMMMETMKEYGHLISIAVVTPLTIIFLEITPKVMAINTPEKLSQRVYPLLIFFHRLFYPVRWGILGFTTALTKLFRLRDDGGDITEDDLGYVVQAGKAAGVLSEEEGEILHNVLRFSRREASNVMFPRHRALFLSDEMTVDEAMVKFAESSVVRAPVYHENIDTVVGMVDSRELLPHYLGYRKKKELSHFIRPVHFTPASRELKDLLHDFLSERLQLAIVVDEYGGTAGVVTLNAILSEILGKGMTHWEMDTHQDIRKNDEDGTVISGEMQIDDFNFTFDTAFVSQNSDTMGGLLFELLGHVPVRGEEITLAPYTLRVRSIRRNRIESIEITTQVEREQ